MEGTAPPSNIKQLAESPHLRFIPSHYVHSTNINHSHVDDDSNSIPIVDFSLLTSHHPHQRSAAIHHLTKACQDWGFFMVVNHGIPENLMKAVIDCTEEFFNLPEKEKQEFVGKHVLDPIRYGTSFNTSKENVFFWRDFLKVFVHPHFHSPSKPQSYGDLILEYSEKLREVARKLLAGISESLGLEESFLDKALDLESGLQVFVGNYYPPCPQPELTMGMPPHSDHGLLTLLINNQVGGLQVQHQGKWINVNALPNSLLVNTGDHLQRLDNITDSEGTPQLLAWWRVRESQFPKLSKMVKDLLAIQATPVASESAFSAGRFQIGDHRYSLAEDSLEISVLFRDWIKAVRRNKRLPRLASQEEAMLDLLIADNNDDDMEHEDRVQNLPRPSVDHAKSL